MVQAPGAEAVQATLDYKGKTYAFCNVDEKAEFISNPSKYAGPVSRTEVTFQSQIIWG